MSTNQKYPNAKKKNPCKLRDTQKFRKRRVKQNTCMPLTVPLLESFIFYAHVFTIARGHLKDVGVIEYAPNVIAPIKPL